MNQLNHIPARQFAAIEPLESRQLLSVATTTSVVPNATTLEFGHTLDLTVAVKAATGRNAPRGRVALYSGRTPSVFASTLSSKGVAHITFGPGYNLYPGTYTFTVRYRPSAGFDVSVSKKMTFTITVPPDSKITESSDGVGTEILAAGKGAAVASGDTVTIEDSGFEADGTFISETYTHTPNFGTATIFATPQQLPHGLDEGIVGMKVGETRVIEVPAALGNGSGKALIFVVHVLSITHH